MSHAADILIVTVNEIEAKAVLTEFESVTGQTPTIFHTDDHSYHHLGVLNGQTVAMVQSEMGSASLGGSLQTIQDAITTLDPELVIMVGVAFGIDHSKQEIGQILVSKQLLFYEPEKIATHPGGDQKLIARGSRVDASAKLLSHLRTVQVHRKPIEPKVYFGLVLCGEKLIDNADFLQKLRALAPEAIGGEMEGNGLYAACQKSKKDWILVKGICDWADGTKNNEKANNQFLAARSASQFVAQAAKATRILPPRPSHSCNAHQVNAVVETPKPPRASSSGLLALPTSRRKALGIITGTLGLGIAAKILPHIGSSGQPARQAPAPGAIPWSSPAPFDLQCWASLTRKLSLDFKEANSSITNPFGHLDVAFKRAKLLRPDRSLATRILTEQDLKVPTYDPRSAPASEPNPLLLAASSSLITKSNRSPFIVDCEAIEPAVVASLLSARRKYGIDIRPKYSGRIGREQLEQIADSGSLPDFIVTALGAMLLLEVAHKLAASYPLAVPLHLEEEYLTFPVEVLADQDVRPNIYYYAQSACEEMLTVLKSANPRNLSMTGQPWPRWVVDAIERATPVAIQSLQGTMEQYQNLEHGQAGIVWAPTSDQLEEPSSLVRVGRPFRHAICLFASSDWLISKAAFRELATFVSVLSYEWGVCKNNFAWVQKLLSEDADFLKAFDAAIVRPDTLPHAP